MKRRKEKKEEKIYREVSSEKEPQSRAKRVRMLLKKNEAVFKDKQALTEFKEPVAFLRRRSGATEIYEDASKGSLVFKHSDGSDREIYLEPSSQGTMDYGKRKFKYYFCHEDYPLPLPENPLVTADTINAIVEKSTMDMRKLNERRETLKLKTIKLLGLLALGAALLYILYKTHAFDKIIGLITGQPYTAPVVNDVVNNGGNGIVEAIKNSSLAVTSSG